MKKMKSSLLVSACLILIFTLTACHSTNQSQKKSKPTTTQTTAKAPQDKGNTTEGQSSPTKTALNVSDPEYFLKQFAQSIGKSPKDLTSADYLKVKTYHIEENENNGLHKPGYVAYDLSFLGKMKNLENLTIYVPYQSPAFFKHLHHLMTLRISNVSLVGYKWSILPDFSNLTSLTDLTLAQDNIEDISFVKPLKNLKRLDLHGNHLGNMQALSHCTSLETLQLYDNPLFFHLEGIENLTHLKSLNVSNDTHVMPMDLTPISGLTQLESLSVGDTYLKDDVSPLEHLTHLKNVGLTNTAISSLTFLKKNHVIQSLGLAGTNMSDLSVLKDKKTLTYLDIRRTRVNSVAPLKDIPHLHFLLLNKNMVSDWTLMKDKKGLQISEGVILAQ